MRVGVNRPCGVSVVRMSVARGYWNRTRFVTSRVSPLSLDPVYIRTLKLPPQHIGELEPPQ